MAFFSAEPGAKEGPDDLHGKLDADHPGANAQDVNVVVLDPLAGGVGV